MPGLCLRFRHVMVVNHVIVFHGPAPQAAALIGDFSNWKEVWMAKDKWGVWEVTLPDGETL